MFPHPVNLLNRVVPQVDTNRIPVPLRASFLQQDIMFRKAVLPLKHLVLQENINQTKDNLPVCPQILGTTQQTLEMLRRHLVLPGNINH